jgi:hypothetical protein
MKQVSPIQAQIKRTLSPYYFGNNNSQRDSGKESAILNGSMRNAEFILSQRKVLWILRYARNKILKNPFSTSD